MANVKKIKIFLILSVLFLGCQEKIPIPEDIATKSDKKRINTVLDDIKSHLFSLDINIDLNKLPIIVSDSVYKNAAGLCYENEAIVISKYQVENHYEPSYPGEISNLWLTLAHEIGHCYFGRNHENKIIRSKPDHTFERKKYWYPFNNTSDLNCYFDYFNSFSGTLMSIDPSVGFVPQEMKQFYLKELAGIITIPSETNIHGFENIKQIHLKQVRPPTEKCKIDE